MPQRPHKAKRDDTPKVKPGAELPYPDTDLPPILQETIRRKIEEGDEGVDEATFMEALRRAARSKRPD
jgi:hypothetical protein